MAAESSFDIISEFDYQELKNAVDQLKKEILNRYDFKGLFCEIELTADKITIISIDKMKLEAVKSVLIQKMVNRKISPKILQAKDIQTVARGHLQLEFQLIKALDQDHSKKISKIIRDQFPKVKPNIEGNTVRVRGKSKDDLQQVINFLREDETISIPLQFVNYR
jgi:hypothetical protein